MKLRLPVALTFVWLKDPVVADFLDDLAGLEETIGLGITVVDVGFFVPTVNINSQYTPTNHSHVQPRSTPNLVNYLYKHTDVKYQNAILSHIGCSFRT